MSTEPQPPAQITQWNGRSGQAWSQSVGLMDQVLQPFEPLLVESISAGSEARILDVGCGAGATTLAAARRVGPAGAVVGVDISEAMITAARARVQDTDVPVSFELGDAQTRAFAPASFDLIMSRFGVMFFPDSVAAFTNLRRAARDGAALRFLCWRGVEQNPFMTTAERAAAPLLPNLPVRQPDQPGQFAFADEHRVRAILDKSGWGDIRIRPADVECTLPEEHLVRYFSQFGVVGLALPDVDEATRTEVVHTVRAAFEPFVHGDTVRFTTACWLVEAAAAH
ncbi:class I SAM-dependent methyltransferase [Nocardia sp. NBC_01327]|uniref:class I SAM-dependent methyltransferase n=1 Tax=Nocardia sp. NBC_01327 TaxID=2903593 RepID=UPI002E12ABB2|nr:class I SAM-dependent methyltransferase [Nocardia sp. NBC_01327]